MSEDFLRAVEVVFKHEGYVSDHPDDRGGFTKFGIASHVYPDLDIKNLTKQQAKEIYYRDYWIPSKAELLPRKIRTAYFSFVVNFGIAGAAKVLQRAAGVKADGIVGPNTLRAVEKVTLERFLIFCMERYMRIIGARPANASFARGWAARCTSFLGEH